MIKDIIYVRNEECPLDTIANLGAAAARAWIFLHKNAVAKLRKSADTIDGCDAFLQLTWRATDKYPSTTLYVENSNKEWLRVLYIKASDISFEYEVSDPKYIFFLKMVE